MARTVTPPFSWAFWLAPIRSIAKATATANDKAFKDYTSFFNDKGDAFRIGIDAATIAGFTANVLRSWPRQQM